jgi:hypothetical protein
VLGELGDAEGFTATGRLLGAETRSHDPEKALAAAIGRRRRALPDFENGFVGGDLTFDQGTDLLRTAKPGQSRSVRGICGRRGSVDAVDLPSATAAKVTAVLIKCCQDMLTERRRYITK